MIDIQTVLRTLLPHFLIAGQFARQIQPEVRRSLKASSETRVSQAVTDADLAIQSYFEVVLLGTYPEFAFYGEEESRNAAYFPGEAEITITLDPINHTLPFQDGLPVFDIILSISQGKEIVAAVTYIPAREEFYLGIKDAGGFFTTKADVSNGAPWQPYRLPDAAAKVLTYNDARLRSLVAREYEVVDLELDYAPETWNTAIHSILLGDIGAYIRPNAHIIDWGAIAFIVVACGGIASDFSGGPLPTYWEFARNRIPSLLVAANSTIHQRLLRVLTAL